MELNHLAGRDGERIFGKLRVSHWNITKRDGSYSLEGFRFDLKHDLFMNITHHCMLYSQRKNYKVIFSSILKLIQLFIKVSCL